LHNHGLAQGPNGLGAPTAPGTARPFIATRERGLPREYGEIIRDALNRHFAAGAQK